jgi:hypothetical protein
MEWRLTIPGQPVSWNAAYRIGTGTRTGTHGRLRLRGEAPATFRKIIKTDEAVAYTATVARLAAVARPSRWEPPGFVIVEFRLFLGRDVDADNVMKLVDDGLEIATGVNDKWYLPRAMSKVWGLRPNERRVELVVSDGASPSSAHRLLIESPTTSSTS